MSRIIWFVILGPGLLCWYRSLSEFISITEQLYIWRTYANGKWWKRLLKWLMNYSRHLLYLLTLYVPLLCWELSSCQFYERTVLVVLCAISQELTPRLWPWGMPGCVCIWGDSLFLSTLFASFSQEYVGLSEWTLCVLL